MFDIKITKDPIILLIVVNIYFIDTLHIKMDQFQSNNQEIIFLENLKNILKMI